MSEHKHTFTFRPVGSIDDQPNAVRRCECGKDLLDAYREQHEEIERLREALSDALIYAEEGVLVPKERSDKWKNILTDTK